MTQNHDSEPPEDQFTEDERITANLRLRSLPATNRTVLGLFAIIPPKWRGPVAIFAIIVIAPIVAFLLYKIPTLVNWFQGK